MVDEELNQAEVEELEPGQAGEEPNQEQPDDIEAKKKAALAGFIMSAIGFSLAFMWVATWNVFGLLCAIAGIILGALAMKKSKAAGDVDVQPFKIFAKLAKIFGLISLILSIVGIVLVVVAWVVAILVVGTTIVVYGIWALVEIIIGAVQQGNSMLVLLAL